MPPDFIELNLGYRGNSHHTVPSPQRRPRKSKGVVIGSKGFVQVENMSITEFLKVSGTGERIQRSLKWVDVVSFSALNG